MNRKDIPYWFFENTPKALANFSPGLERSDNPGSRTLIVVGRDLKIVSQKGSRSSNPGLKLANASGVFSN